MNVCKFGEDGRSFCHISHQRNNVSTVGCLEWIVLAQYFHTEHLSISFVKVVVDKCDDNDVSKQHEVGEQAKCHEKVRPIAEQMRQNKNDRVRKIAD